MGLLLIPTFELVVSPYFISFITAILSQNKYSLDFPGYNDKINNENEKTIFTCYCYNSHVFNAL